MATAAKVGGRRGRPLVLTILAGRAHRDGCAFFRSANGVWLTGHVPPAHLVFDKSDENIAPARKEIQGMKTPLKG